ncbi:MAG TPA: RDD family protein [Thermoanaerobaculia bacterium]|nr:RDD family protein [Thermoanaerobaculia bacterium]HUM30247.1 RDD family protein [Thermoanaerobaculia bacterium]HXK68457.1 RDD family protein [Thermoanaerobaculia bacterium]
MTDDLSDLPLHEEGLSSSGIAFQVDLHPHPRPREGSPVRRLLAALFDGTIWLLTFLALLLLLRITFSSSPWLPHILSASIESFLLAGLGMLLPAFFWGQTAGMALFRLTMVDRDGEPPDAQTTVGWFGLHLLSCLTLGIFGTLYHKWAIDRPYFIVDSSSREAIE